MRTLAVIASALLSLATVQAAGEQSAAVPLRVFCSNGIRVALERLLPDAERAIGRPLSIRFSSSAALKQSIDQGEAFDVAILTPELVDGLIRDGTLRAGTRRDLAAIDLAVGVRTGAPRADISTPDAIRRRLPPSTSGIVRRAGAA